MSVKEASTLSSLSLGSEDWDRSEDDIDPSHPRVDGRVNATPRNSVVFPVDGIEDTPGRHGGLRGAGRRRDERSLSELMRLHAEKGTDVNFSAEEASRVADVLKQWINSGMSPYESEDDFFPHAQDDSSLRSSRHSSRLPVELNGRPRGQSESVTLRPDCASASS